MLLISEAQWRIAYGAGVAVIWRINQNPADTFALVSLTKTRHGNTGSGAGGYSGIVSVDGDQLDNRYPPAAYKSRMASIEIGVVSEGQYAECMVSLFRG